MNALPVRLAICSGALLGLAAVARADAMPMMEFNARIEQWLSEQKDPPPLTYIVEGVISASSSERLLLAKCKHVVFELKTELPPLSQKRPTVELTGKLHFSKRNSEFTFDVFSVREVPGDVEKYHAMRRKLRQQPAEKWYELGQWAKARGKFYENDELLKLSEDAFREGFQLERKELARDNPEGLLKLADKVQRLQPSLSLRGELAHEAFYMLCDKSKKLSVPAIQDLAKRMTGYFPGCTTPPIRSLSPDLVKKYNSQPLEMYAAADNETRARIHRLLYAGLVLRTITAGAADDGSNGFEIAAQIENDVPEQRLLAEKYRDLALAAQAADVETLTRSQLLDLARKYRDRQQNKEADHLIETWLTIRLRKLEADDTEGLLELTDDYRKLLRQNDVANRLLIDAWKRNPKAADITERLENEGYHLDGTNWVTAAEFNSRPEGQLEQAIREGRVEPGMTVSHVRRSLGEPAAQARAATAGQVTEVWRYEFSGSTQLVVRFVRRAAQAEMTVVGVAHLRRP